MRIAPRIATLAALLALGVAAFAADAERDAEVARRGAEVMPFDLAATTHVFTKTADGGTERVVAKRRGDEEQTKLVRAHLHEIQGRFQQRDFSAPARIHGNQMPGLAELQAAAPGAIAIAYRDVPDGAELTFGTKDARLVAALHRWIDAQLSEHGHDAREGHAHPAP